jgi:HAD superfamily hydrolase (TIGR01509 family)
MEPHRDEPRDALNTVLLDIDGTLLDSNEAHAQAWVEVLQRHGRPTPYERIRPLIGMGGDKVLAELFGIVPDDPLAQRIGTDRRRLFLDHALPALHPTRGARALLERLKAEGLARVVATSSSGEELGALLRQADVDDLVERSATASDAEHTKPDPDIVQAALAKARVAPAAAIMIGDTPYDIEAAAAAGVATIALRCGGFWDDAALRGAAAIYDDPQALLDDWDRSPLGRRSAAATTRG